MQKISASLTIASLASATMLRVKNTDAPLIEGCECLTSYGGALDDITVTRAEVLESDEGGFPIEEIIADFQEFIQVTDAFIEGDPEDPDTWFTFLYPSSYGLNECAAHDRYMPDFCGKIRGIIEPNSPAFCDYQWCFVNPETC